MFSRMDLYYRSIPEARRVFSFDIQEKSGRDLGGTQSESTPHGLRSRSDPQGLDGGSFCVELFSPVEMSPSCCCRYGYCLHIRHCSDTYGSGKPAVET